MLHPKPIRPKVIKTGIGSFRLSYKHLKPSHKRHSAPGRMKTPSMGKLLKDADKAFSMEIRARDKHCMFPNCKSVKGLQCSHYHGRAIKSTRFDEENCIALCYFHHFRSKDLGFEYQKQTKKKHGYDGQYTIWMKNWLGTQRFKALAKRAAQKQTLSREFLQSTLASLKEVVY